MVTYVFPGQGSQSKGMGSGVFEEFADLTALADRILGYSIQELCAQDSDQKLSKTQYTQPALYTVNALSYLQKVQETGCKPDYVAGHSLGEYNALFAAGAFDFETGLKLVKKRGELMSQASGGGMAAVIGLSEAQAAEVLHENQLSSIDIANLNSPFQIVISGPSDAIAKANAIFSKHKAVKMVAPLKTSGAFHSRYMAEAQQEFQNFIQSLEFKQLEIPVISNVQARPYRQADLKRNLVAQIVHTVKWTESIRYLMGLGEMEFVEIGNGRVLTGLIQRIQKEAEPLIVEENEAMAEPPAPEQTATATDTHHPEKLHGATHQGKNPGGLSEISAKDFGNSEFKTDYRLKYAYISGAMYRAVASGEMVVKMGQAGMMGFFGTGGLSLGEIETAIQTIQKKLTADQAYGMNLLHQPANSEMEAQTVNLYLKYQVRHVEAAAFLSITPALVIYRAKGLQRGVDGQVSAMNKIMAKLSRPEVAKAFLSPAPERIVSKLLLEKKITQTEADLLKRVPMADDLSAEADSGGHTDGGVAYALLPAIMSLRDEMMREYGYAKRIRVGAAGGIGTPEAAAAAFILGADYIVTGSINQCTVEAGTSDTVKDLLQQINIQDTEYAPAGDMFELGAKVQVLKKGVFFPARANKLYELYRQYNSIDEIDEKTQTQLQEKYFKRSFEQIFEELKGYYPAMEIEKAQQNPKHKMALIFRWYFGYSSRLALSGDESSKVDYQVHCGPALGSFNQWVKGTDLENWRNRHVDVIGIKIMEDAVKVIQKRLQSFGN